MKSLLIFVVVGIAAVSAQEWQNYVDYQLVGAGMKSAAIFGHDGSVFAKTNAEPTAEETNKILEQFNNPVDVFVSGITFGGVKYLGMNGETDYLLGKKDTGGIICVKTNQVVIVGVYDHTLQPGVASKIVGKLGDYLKETGY